MALGTLDRNGRVAVLDIGKIYRGLVPGGDQTNETLVTVGVQVLDPRLDLMNHSPTGLSWGYCGSGPAQLALAILADFLEDDRAAVMLHQDFKNMIISRLPGDRNWTLTGLEVQQAVEAIRRKA